MVEEAANPRSHLRDLAAFIALSVGLSWAVWAILLLAAGDSAVVAVIAGPVGAFAPPLAAAFLTWRIHGSLRPFWSPILRWSIGRWWLAVAGAPLTALIIGWMVLGLLGRPPLPEALPDAWMLPLLFVFMLLVGGGQEEAGWRGFALPRLQARMNALWASVVIGIVWAGWHLPLFLLPGTGQAALNLPMYVLYVAGLSVILTWIYNSTVGSVLAVMVLHGLVNLLGVFIPVWTLFEAQLATLIGVWLVAGALLLSLGPVNLSRRRRVVPVDLTSLETLHQRRGEATP